MSAIEGVVAYQGWSLRGVPLYTCKHTFSHINIILANHGRNPRILPGFDYFSHDPDDSLQNLGNFFAAV